MSIEQSSASLQDGSSDHFIGIDVGTGSVRACIINSAGDIIALATENIGLWEPKPGYYEQSTADIWESICKSVKLALSQSRLLPSAIRGIGFDATCSLAVFTYDTDEPVSVTGPDFDLNDHNIILWLDHRPIEEAEKINVTKHNVLKYVGGTMSVEMEIPKILWLKNHLPKALFDRCAFFDLVDAITHMATGNRSRSKCSAVCKQGYIPVGVDGSVKGWQEDFLREIGLPELCNDNFIRMGGVDEVNGNYCSAGELVGGLSKKAAFELGLSPGIAVGSGVIDAYAGWIGTVGAKVEGNTGEFHLDVAANDPSQAFTRLAAVAGTSTCHLIMSPKPVFVPGVWGPYRDVTIPEYWMAEGGQSATGQLLKHMIETHPAHKDALIQAESAKLNIYQYLNGHLEKMQSDQHASTISHLGRHIFFYGDLYGNRSPMADPSMTGAIIGLTSDTSITNLALIYYAAMESIALQTHHIIDTMNRAGHAITSIFLSGSQCQNPILMHLIASACGIPVVIPRYVHAAVVHGAAMLGAKAASADPEGMTEPLWEIMTRMSKPGGLVRPSVDEGEKALLRVKYAVFLEQGLAQRDYRRRVDELVKK